MIFFVLLVVLMFLATVFFGAPFVASKNEFIDDAIDLLKQTNCTQVADFGSGDGRVLRALNQNGYKATGYEINPILFIISWLRFYKNDNVQVKFKNYLSADIITYDAIFIFTAGPYLKRLQSVLSDHEGLYLLSVGFEFGNLTHIKSSGIVNLYRV